MKLIVSFVQYNTEKYPSSLLYLIKYLKKIKNHYVEIIVVDNKRSSNLFNPIIKDNITYIDGDNTCWEFSGHTKVIEYLKSINDDYSSILFVNDSFLAPGGNDSPSVIINDNCVYECRKNDKIIGNILDAEPYELIIDKYNIKKYMRTHCFMLSKNIINKIKTLVTLNIDFIDKCISSNASYPYILLGAPINSVAKNNIVRNLQLHWHSPINIEKEWDFFRMKSLMLLNELSLYTRITEDIG